MPDPAPGHDDVRAHRRADRLGLLRGGQRVQPEPAGQLDRGQVAARHRLEVVGVEQAGLAHDVTARPSSCTGHDVRTGQRVQYLLDTASKADPAMPSATSRTSSRAHPGSSRVGQRRLRLHRAPDAPAAPDLHELGPAALGQPEVREGAGLDRELVRRELAVPGDLVLAGLAGRGPGLEVDDHRAAEVVALDPVDPAAEPGPADGGRELLLHGDQVAGAAREPGGQPADHRLGPAALAAGDPAGAQVDGPQQLVEPGEQRRLGARRGVDGSLGDGVHQGADVLRRAAGLRRRRRARGTTAAGSAGTTRPWRG